MRGCRPPMIAFAVINQRPADLVTYPDGRVEAYAKGSGAAVAETWNAERRTAHALTQRERMNQGLPRPEPSAEEVGRILAERIATWRATMEAELERREREAVPGLGTPEGRRQNYLNRHPIPTAEDV